MNTLTIKAEKIHNGLSNRNFIFKELKWYKNPTYIHHSILVLTAIPMFIYLNSNKIPYVFLIWGVNMIIVQFILFDYINKLICKKLKLKMIKKGSFRKFPTLKYRQKTNKLYYKRMISKGHLFGNNKDIRLLEIIEEETKSNLFTKRTTYGLQNIIKRLFPVITLLFGIYTTLILSNSRDFITDSKLILAYSILLIIIIFIALYTDYIVLESLNVKYRKQKQFLNRITSLKNNLKLKYK
ncbi:hypothetical protein [Maribacter sp. 2210JD10-5]|uniref:hypothetical protein n=1 Tax=Maribacter sp. 2210JD10-5 TaxID=3386272 RepID=UPI0039BCC3F2